MDYEAPVALLRLVVMDFSGVVSYLIGDLSDSAPGGL